MRFSRLLLTLLLPPFSVYLDRGLGAAFWLNVVMTLAAFVPGVAHAWVIARRGRR